MPRGASRTDFLGCRLKKSLVFLLLASFAVTISLLLLTSVRTTRTGCHPHLWSDRGEPCNPPPTHTFFFLPIVSLWYVNTTVHTWMCVSLCVSLCVCVCEREVECVYLCTTSESVCACAAYILDNVCRDWMSHTSLWCWLVQWYCMFVISEADFN